MRAWRRERGQDALAPRGPSPRQGHAREPLIKSLGAAYPPPRNARTRFSTPPKGGVIPVARASRLVSLPPWGGVEKASSLFRWGVGHVDGLDQRSLEVSALGTAECLSSEERGGAAVLRGATQLRGVSRTSGVPRRGPQSGENRCGGPGGRRSSAPRTASGRWRVRPPRKPRCRAPYGFRSRRR